MSACVMSLIYADAVRSRDEPVQNDIVRGMTDCLVPSQCDVGCGGFLLVQISLRRVVVRGPGVVHRRRKMKQIAGMHRGPRRVEADGVQQLLIPKAGHRFGRLHTPSGIHEDQQHRQTHAAQAPQAFALFVGIHFASQCNLIGVKHVVVQHHLGFGFRFKIRLALAPNLIQCQFIHHFLTGPSRQRVE